MPRAVLSSGIELEHETFGDGDDPTLLLVGGFTSQLSGWDARLCERVAEQGLHVVRYDNRDVGLSTKMTGTAEPAKVLAAILAGGPVPTIPTRSPTGRPTASGCSTTSASIGPTSPECRWAG